MPLYNVNPETGGMICTPGFLQLCADQVPVGRMIEAQGIPFIIPFLKGTFISADAVIGHCELFRMPVCPVLIPPHTGICDGTDPGFPACFYLCSEQVETVQAGVLRAQF